MCSLKKFVFLFIVAFYVCSCGGKDIVDQSIIDPDSNMTRKEFKDFMNNKNVTPNRNQPGLSNRAIPPNISRLLVAPPPPPMGNGELISFSVTEEVPIKDVLIELGRIADVDIEVDPNITGGIILKVTNKPLDVIVKRIADLSNLKYSYTNNILRVEKDLPYTITYNVDFLIDNEVWGTIESALNDIIALTNAPKSGGVSSSEVEGVVDVAIPEPKIIINKPAGMITVYANERTQKAVDGYIDHVKTNYAAQVLIEAKVVEVALNDTYKMGIDWSFMNEGKGSIVIGTNEGSPGGIDASITTAIFGGSLTAAISALDTFGLTKTLSSPRVHAMNNQKAELKFVNKLVYFSLEKEEEDDDDNNKTKTTYTATKQEEDVGVTMNIIPSINLLKNEITLSVIPELKVKVGEVVDPTNELNKVPVIQNRTVQTTLKVKSGNILVIGGLMTEDTTSTDTGVPILSGIPWLGHLFKTTNRTKSVSETVIFIKATIIKPNGEVGNYDRELYKKFTNNNGDFF